MNAAEDRHVVLPQNRNGATIPPALQLGTTVPIRWFAVGLASAILLIALHMESAQAARTAYTSLRVHCLKQVGAYRGADGRWRFYGARNSAQWQNFYNCLDANTMNRR